MRLHPPAPGVESDPVPMWIRNAATKAATGIRRRSARGRRSSTANRTSGCRATYGDGRRAGEPNDRAYAYYRAIKCYAPGGTNECGGKDVPKNVRKRWFDTLKASYAAAVGAEASLLLVSAA
ncbi:hypothetical protein CFB34_038950 [Burkholderia sp. HI4860]|uniref:hypothetical protein n=1 Tax=Burkholderia sp. HI4860 TaxID=2015361 RepID=UPI001F620CFC|nr:hypothetical protein [Burkholderia sp. HI4860]MCI3974961.1 hypothetical protein [Burkholderia sp. HI4860]